MKKITIGLFNDSFFPMADGVVMVVDNYARRLSKVANVIVFAPSYKGKKYDDSVFPYQVVRCHSLDILFLDYSLPTPKLDIKFEKMLNKYKLDIVHIHSPFTLGKAGLTYAKKHHIPCIASMHSQFKQDFYKATHSEFLSNLLLKKIMRVFNKCDEIWAVNDETSRIFTEEYGYKGTPRVMLNATDMMPVDNPNAAIKLINEKHNIDKNDKVFLFVGRINTLKNIIFIADALKELKEMDKKLKFKMLYVGSGRDEEILKKHIEDIGLEKEVILCGRVMNRDELAAYYKRADLFLFPSVYDTSGIVRIEAASQNTPGVYLKGTATASMITDNVNGYVSDYTVPAFAKRIIDAMSDERKYKEIAQNAYKDLYITWDDEVVKVFNIYKEFIEKNKQNN